jgi:hypothetical protein
MDRGANDCDTRPFVAEAEKLELETQRDCNLRRARKRNT